MSSTDTHSVWKQLNVSIIVTKYMLQPIHTVSGNIIVLVSTTFLPFSFNRYTQCLETLKVKCNYQKQNLQPIHTVSGNILERILLGIKLKALQPIHTVFGNLAFYGCLVSNKHFN